MKVKLLNNVEKTVVKEMTHSYLAIMFQKLYSEVRMRQNVSADGKELKEHHRSLDVILQSFCNLIT